MSESTPLISKSNMESGHKCKYLLMTLVVLSILSNNKVLELSNDGTNILIY